MGIVAISDSRTSQASQQKLVATLGYSTCTLIVNGHRWADLPAHRRSSARRSHANLRHYRRWIFWWSPADGFGIGSSDPIGLIGTLGSYARKSRKEASAFRPASPPLS